jgi:hypothetical protein
MQEIYYEEVFFFIGMPARHVFVYMLTEKPE